MKRYKEQILLPEIGVLGQTKILNSKVLVIGAGGLGTIVCSYLSSMGIGKIGICDFDLIEESNLHRQFLYTHNDIGNHKSKILTNSLKKNNPKIEIETFLEYFNNNSKNIIKDYQIICDCTDNFETRTLINEVCHQKRIPLVYGAVSEWHGYVSIFNYKNDYNLTDLFDKQDFLDIQSCSQIGINSTICGVIGSIMANEIIKIILDLENILDGKILYFNSLTNTFKKFNLNKNQNS